MPLFAHISQNTAEESAARTSNTPSNGLKKARKKHCIFVNQGVDGTVRMRVGVNGAKLKVLCWRCLMFQHTQN